MFASKAVTLFYISFDICIQLQVSDAAYRARELKRYLESREPQIQNDLNDQLKR